MKLLDQHAKRSTKNRWLVFSWWSTLQGTHKRTFDEKTHAYQSDNNHGPYGRVLELNARTQHSASDVAKDGWKKAGISPGPVHSPIVTAQTPSTHATHYKNSLLNWTDGAFADMTNNTAHTSNTFESLFRVCCNSNTYHKRTDQVASIHLGRLFWDCNYAKSPNVCGQRWPSMR